MASMTAYKCPLCGEEIHREYDEIRKHEKPNGDLVVETPLGRALRIETIVVDHMTDVHGLTAEQAVEQLSGMSAPAKERD